MIIDRNIKRYIVFKEDPIVRGLEKMDANKMRVVFVVNESGLLEGVLTDGDVRRWMIQQSINADLQTPIFNICNKEFAYCQEGMHPLEINRMLTERIEYVPLLDDQKHLLAIATKRIADIQIGGRKISENQPAFVIAEIGNNHNGSITMAKEMIDAALDAGADCVKFQLRNLEDLYINSGNPNDAGEDLGSQYVLDLLSKYQLTNDELFEAFDYCKQKNSIPMCTPWDKASVQLLDDYGVEVFKVASADFTNHELLETIAEKGKIMICSTGMCTEQEVLSGTQVLKNYGTQFILLHCNSTYPSPFKDINLNYIDRLKEISRFPVGYSGHERGGHIAVAAVAKGAKVIEKHFTFDRTMEGNDHKVSLLPSEFKKMVEDIREVELALGANKERLVTQGELINRESLGKSLTINCDLAKGEIISEQFIEIKSPGKGIPPYRKNELIGKMAERDLTKGDCFFEEDLGGQAVKARDFNFVHPFGVPVRYHDAVKIGDTCAMDLLEIHLSYKDLDENIGNFFQKPFKQELVVHSPELFIGDHILDLCSFSQDYRERSIRELQRVIDITNSLKKYFPKTEQPPIVVNVGGFSADRFMPESVRKECYSLLKQSLEQLDSSGVELLPQTMPPFPWHFGGQRYHNLFVDAKEIVTFCEENNYRICFDLSHSKLACNYDKYSFTKFIEEVAPYTAHLHIADAKGVDGEGLQIGDGEIDFMSLMPLLSQLMPKSSFIPEIWQGHKNNGQGFWIALDRLEKMKLAK